MADSVWLPTDTSSGEAESLLTDPRWALQEKCDGIHVVLERVASGLAATNRRGEPRAVNGILIKPLEPLPIGTMLDGEWLHSGSYVAFDVLRVGEMDLRPNRYEVRYAVLEDLFRRAILPVREIELVRHAVDRPGKDALIDTLRRESAEGVIFKYLDAPYTQGRPIEGGTMRRWKWRKRADVLVGRRPDDTTRSFEMFAFGNGELVNLGSVSAHRFYDALPPQAVAIGEVEYLYASPTMKLVQPTLLRWRPDKKKEDCTVDQLEIGGRFKVAS